MYHKVSFCGGSNIDIKLIMCEDKIFITPKLRIYVLHWYHMYLLHPVINRTEAIIFQHFYWPGIIPSDRKEVSNYDTCQHTKLSNKKYGKLPAKLDEEISWNKICL